MVSVTYWSAWKLCLLITFSRELPPEKGGGTAMKKLLLGLGMLLSGTVGFTGCLYGTDWLPVLFFAAMAAAGLALAVREARRDS